MSVQSFLAIENLEKYLGFADICCANHNLTLENIENVFRGNLLNTLKFKIERYFYIIVFKCIFIHCFPKNVSSVLQTVVGIRRVHDDCD